MDIWINQHGLEAGAVKTHLDLTAGESSILSLRRLSAAAMTRARGPLKKP